MKRDLALILAALMLLSCLAGCSKDKAGEAPEASKAEASQDSPVADTISAKYAYSAEYIDIPVDTNYVSNVCLSGSALYFEGSVAVGQESYTDEVTGESYTYDTYESRLFRLDLETRAFTQLEALPEPELEEGWEGDTYTQAMAAGADGTLWLCRQTYSYRYDLPENFDEAADEMYDYYQAGQNSVELLQIDASGSLLQTVSLAEAGPGLADSGVSGIFLDSKGYLYVATWEAVFVWDKDGVFVMELPMGDMGGDVRQYDADHVGAILWGQEGQTFRVIDPEAGDWGEELPIPANAWQISPGSGEYDLYYQESGKVYGYIAETDTSEKVIDWLECDIDSNAMSSNSFAILPDGQVVVVLQDMMAQGPSKPQVAVLSRVDADTLPEKTELILACMYMDYDLRSQIVNFNRSNQKYRIVVKDYSEYATEEDYNAGLTILNTEILSGQLPDMLLTSDLPVKQYAARGLLTDLWQYIDADENIKKEDLMTQVLDALSVDGRLYEMPTYFYVQTVAGLEQTVGEYKDTWSVEAMRTAMEKLKPEATIFAETTTKEEMLAFCVVRDADRFIDWTTGECFFDSPEFLELLHFADQFALEFDYDSYDWETDYESDFLRMRDGRQLLSNLTLSSFDDLSVYCQVLDDQPCFVGYPVGARHSLSNSASLAICADSENKDAAWAFIRTLLMPEYQKTIWGFPMNRKVFEEKAAEAMTPVYEKNPDGSFRLDEDGNKIEQSQGGMGWGNEEMYEIYAVTQDQYDLFLEVLDQCAGGYSYDQEIAAILTEEAAPFFAGEKSAEDAAKAIQSRVKIYVAEQG